MNTLLYLNETTKTISTSSGTWSPATLTFAETLKAAVRFTKDISGTTTEITEEVSYIKAALGELDLRPESGTWKLKVGDAAQSTANTTGELAWNITIKALETAINALPAIVAQFGAVTVTQANGSFFFRFGSGTANVPVSLVDSELEPPCAGLTSAWQVAGKWIQELRLAQAPAAFTDASERILPDAPTIARVQAGYTSEAYTVNEIQQMTMPPEFRGSYQFRFNNVRTALLSRDDDTDAIATALAKFGDGITVTNPRSTIARIEFGGDFAGLPQSLLEIIVADAPEGDLTFSIALDEPALAALLRENDPVTLPLEIEVGIVDSAETSGIRIEKFRTEISIQRGVIFGLLASANNVDWLRPMPTDYVPFTMDQVFQGQLYYAAPLGDGEAVSFVIDHNLNSDAIASVLVRENIADGRVLVLGTDYTVVYGGANSLTITLAAGATAPAAAGLLAVITAAGMRDAFHAHTHTIEQIIGLSEALEEVGQRLTALEAYIPTNTVASTSSSSTLEIDIPAAAGVLFWSPSKLDLTTLPARAPFLLPAVHNASPTELPETLPAASDNADAVWTASARTLIPGSRGRIPSSYVESGGFVASDGRMLYPASQSEAGKVSYYPSAFERTLFEFAINDLQLLAGRYLTLEFGLGLQLINADCEAQWVLVLEHGTPVAQSAPSPAGTNLETVTWTSTPLLKQRLLVSPLLIKHTFGCQIIRSTDGISANQIRYGASSVADSAPTTANFVLRARLIEFDTKNNVHNACGWLYNALGSVKDITAAITAEISS